MDNNLVLGTKRKSVIGPLTYATRPPHLLIYIILIRHFWPSRQGQENTSTASLQRVRIPQRES